MSWKYGGASGCPRIWTNGSEIARHRQGAGALFFARCHMPNQKPPDPFCKAFLICQKTIVEAETDIVSLIGIFDGFVVGNSGLTAVAEVFCRITEAHGKYKITVEIQDLNTGSAIAGASGPEIDIPNRLATANVIIPIPPLPLPPGQYDLVMFANESEIDRQKFVVQKIERKA
jgi:hypothetical protein